MPGWFRVDPSLGHKCTTFEEVALRGGTAEQPPLVDQTGMTRLREYPARYSVHLLAQNDT